MSDQHFYFGHSLETHQETGHAASPATGERATIRCPTCGHDRETYTSDEGTSGFVPPALSDVEREARECLESWADAPAANNVFYRLTARLLDALGAAREENERQHEGLRQAIVKMEALREENIWLRAATKELRRGDGTYYTTEERAFAPGISGDWPNVIPHPTTRNGRLVKHTFPKEASRDPS